MIRYPIMEEDTSNTETTKKVIILLEQLCEAGIKTTGYELTIEPQNVHASHFIGKYRWQMDMDTS